jgi:hypothetical protein
VQACHVWSIVLPSTAAAIPQNNNLGLILLARKERNRTAVCSQSDVYLKESNPENLMQLISCFGSYRQPFIDSLIYITVVEGDFDMMMSLNSISKFCPNMFHVLILILLSHVPSIFYSICYYNQQKNN